jgi:hypothetical protein
MNNSTLVEAYFDNTQSRLNNQAVETGFASIDTLATMLSNMREPLSPQLCEAIGQHIKEVSMLTFLAYEKAVKH